MHKPSNKESVQDTVARLRASRNQQQPKTGKNATYSSEERSQLNTPTRSKASKNAKAISAAERKTEANKIIKQLLFEQAADHPTDSAYPEGFYLKDFACRVI